MLYSFENSLRILHCSAAFISLAGVKWSGTRAILSLLKTSFAPIFLNSAIAIGAVISFARIRSTFAFINSPGDSSFLFVWADKIFSEIVISFSLSLFYLYLYLVFTPLERTAK